MRQIKEEQYRDPNSKQEQQQRPMSGMSSSFNSGSMFSRSNQLQSNEHDGENMTSLHAKLHLEADKIRKWKAQTEMDLKEKDKRLAASSSQIETMKKSMLELQLDNEKLSSRMQEEIDNRGQIVKRIAATRELCDILKSTATNLNDRIHHCETEKTELKYAGRETSQHLEDLGTKFAALQVSSENNQQKLMKNYEQEKQDNLKKIQALYVSLNKSDEQRSQLEEQVNAKTQAISSLEEEVRETKDSLVKLYESLSKLEKANKGLQEEGERKDTAFKESALRVLTIQDEKRELEGKLQSCESELQELQETKDRLIMDGTESNARYEEQLRTAKQQIEQLQQAFDNEQKSTKYFENELQETQSVVENLKSSRDLMILERTELELKIETSCNEISNLRKDIEDGKTELYEVNGEMEVLTKRLDKEHLCHLQSQEAEKDLESKICALKLDRDEQSQLISQLEQTLDTTKNEMEIILAREQKQQENLCSEISSKESTLQEERTQIETLKNDLDNCKKDIRQKDDELQSKQDQLKDLEGRLQEMTSSRVETEKQMEEVSNQFDEFRKTYDEEKQKSDDLCNQLKDISLEKKEHGKSLASTQKKAAAQTKQIKDLEKKVKSLESDLNKEVKQKEEKEEALSGLQQELDELKQSNKDLDDTKTECEVKMKALKQECERDKTASKDAIAKAQKLQDVAKKETENAKALTECQLAEMMRTLDSYKQSSETLLADKEKELKCLKNKLDALELKTKTEKDKLNEENSTLSAELKTLSTEKKHASNELTAAQDENEDLRKKIQELESQAQAASIKMVTHISSVRKTPGLDSRKPLTPHSVPPIAPVTPQKQIPSTPKNMKTPLNAGTSGLQTPQRSILRASSSTKRRKVAFMAEDESDIPYSSDDLMEVEIDGKATTGPADKFRTPVSTNKTPRMAAMSQCKSRVTPKLASNPLKSPLIASTPKKKPEEPIIAPQTNIRSTDRARCFEERRQVAEPVKNPNVRTGTVRKTSKFFTQSPKDKALSRSKKKDKNKKGEEEKLSWFDIDSVYGFGPED